MQCVRQHAFSMNFKAILVFEIFVLITNIVEQIHFGPSSWGLQRALMKRSDIDSPISDKILWSQYCDLGSLNPFQHNVVIIQAESAFLQVIILPEPWSALR
jgi:hypothetical protein